MAAYMRGINHLNSAAILKVFVAMFRASEEIRRWSRDYIHSDLLSDIHHGRFAQAIQT